MVILSSILAGEIILILEDVSSSVRIIDFERILQASKRDINFAVARLLSEGLIKLIKEDERIAIILIQENAIYKNNYLENNMSEHLVAVN